MEKIAVAADSHGKPKSAGDQTAKSPTDCFNSGSSWKQVLIGGGIPGGGKAGADPSSGLETSVSSSSVLKPTYSSTSSAPMEIPPPPEPVSPSPENPEAADCSQNSNVYWPALGQLRKKSPLIPKDPADGVSVVKEASKKSSKPGRRRKRLSEHARGPNPVQPSTVPVVHEIAPKNTPNVLEPSSSGTKLVAGPLHVVIDHPNERGSSSRGPDPEQDSSVPLVHEIAPKNTSAQTPNVLEPSSSNTMVGSSGDPPAVSNQSKRRGSSRRRGNGSYHRGSQRDNDRGPLERNNSTVSSTRGASSSRGTNLPFPMRVQGRGYVRPTLLGNLPFMASPPPVRPYGGPLFYPYGAPFMHFIPTVPGGYHPAMSFSHLPPPFRPPPFIHHPALLHGNTLPSMVVEQIDFYFSEANLVKDEYLRSKMDNEGWVPVSLIASFPRVRQLTSSIPLILDSLRASYVVEVQGDKIRKRHGWRKWVTHGLPFHVPVAGG